MLGVLVACTLLRGAMKRHIGICCIEAFVNARGDFHHWFLRISIFENCVFGDLVK
jgi:hypothetical protein